MRLRPVLSTLVGVSLLTLFGASSASTITVWDYYGSTSPIPEIAANFEKENPDIDVQVEQIGGLDTLLSKLSTVVAGGSGADVVTTGLMWAPQFKVFGAYQDLTELSGGMINGQPVDDVFPTPLLEAAREGDALYGVPYDFDAFALYYRTDAYEAAGISEPPKTLDELKDVSCKLAGQSTQSGLMLTNEWAYYDPFMYAFGGRYIDDSGQPSLNSPENVAALQYMADMVSEGCAMFWDSSSQGEIISGIKSNQFAQFISGPYMMGVLRGVAPEMSGSWKVAMDPKGKAFGTHIGGTHLSILKSSQNAEASWKFIEYALRPENQVLLWQKAGAAPAYLPALEDPQVQQPDPYFSDQQTVEIFSETVTLGTPNPTISEWSDLTAIINQAIGISLAGVMEPQDALDEAQAQAGNLFR